MISRFSYIMPGCQKKLPSRNEHKCTQCITYIIHKFVINRYVSIIHLGKPSTHTPLKLNIILNGMTTIHTDEWVFNVDGSSGVFKIYKKFTVLKHNLYIDLCGCDVN